MCSRYPVPCLLWDLLLLLIGGYCSTEVGEGGKYGFVGRNALVVTLLTIAALVSPGTRALSDPTPPPLHNGQGHLSR